MWKHRTGRNVLIPLQQAVNCGLIIQFSVPDDYKHEQDSSELTYDPLLGLPLQSVKSLLLILAVHSFPVLPVVTSN